MNFEVGNLDHRQIRKRRKQRLHTRVQRMTMYFFCLVHIYNGEGKLSLHNISNVRKFQWDCDRCWGSSPSFKCRRVGTANSNFVFCAMFELMYFWMYMKYPNDNLEYDRIDPGDSNNSYRKPLQW